MPIYAFGCENCDYKVDKLMKMSDKPPKKCPECGKMKLKKLISAGSFRITGGGVHKPTSKMD